MTSAATAALVATLALGVLVGIAWLQGLRRPLWVKAHLYVAVAAGALVLGAVILRVPGAGGPPGFVPVLLLGLAIAAGYFAYRTGGLRKAGAERLLALHIVAGIAGFFAFLSWMARL